MQKRLESEVIIYGNDLSDGSDGVEQVLYNRFFIGIKSGSMGRFLDIKEEISRYMKSKGLYEKWGVNGFSYVCTDA